MCNIPDNNSIYLLNNLGFSNICTKKDDKYICNDIMYGKTPILNTSKCLWEFCNTNIKTGEVDLSNCKETTYPYYVENADKGCILKKLDDKEFKQTTTKDCCCNPDSLCDYINCCDKVPIDKCDYKDFQGKSFDNTYFVSPGEFACVNLECIQIPPNYKGNESKYPMIKNSIDKNGIFNSNLCNCVKDSDSCNNKGDCQPQLGCAPCVIGPIGKYSCILDTTGQYSCQLDPNGIYQTETDCKSDCFQSKRYICTDNNCKEDKDGPYYSLSQCQNTCIQLESIPYDYNPKEQTIKIIKVFSIIMLLVILLVILFYVFSIVRKKLN